MPLPPSRSRYSDLPIEALPEVEYRPRLAAPPEYGGDWPGTKVVVLTAVIRGRIALDANSKAQ